MLRRTLPAGGEDRVGVAVLPDWQNTPIREGAVGIEEAASRRPPNYSIKKSAEWAKYGLDAYNLKTITLLGIVFVSLDSEIVGAKVEGHKYTRELWDASLAEDESNGITPKLSKH